MPSRKSYELFAFFYIGNVDIQMRFQTGSKKMHRRLGKTARHLNQYFAACS